MNISIVIPIYNNDAMLHNAIMHYQYEAHCFVDGDIEIVAVLDGYTSQLDFSLYDIPMQVYQIHDHITWNQPGARNLGAMCASHEWILFTDVDHRVTISDIPLYAPLHKSTIYHFPRTEDTGKAINPSPSTMLLYHTHTCLWFDEDFSGHYGSDDIHFLWKARCMHMNIRVCNAHNTAITSGHTDLYRDRETNRELLSRKITNHDFGGDILRFDYSQIL